MAGELRGHQEWRMGGVLYRRVSLLLQNSQVRTWQRLQDGPGSGNALVSLAQAWLDLPEHVQRNVGSHDHRGQNAHRIRREAEFVLQGQPGTTGTGPPADYRRE